MKTSVILLALLSVTLFLMGCLSDSHDDSDSDGGHADHNHAQELDTVGEPVDPSHVVTKAFLLERGRLIYEQVCSHCHQPGGVGFGETPPLAESDFLMADRMRPVGILLKGLKGQILVNGLPYNSVMPAVKGSDLSIAAVLTYVRGQFNGATDSISVEEVRAERKALGL